MLPSELKLTTLKHCYVHLPETFVSHEPSLKGGNIVSIRSIQNDIEIHVMWNGQLTSGEHVELDLTFAQANQFKDELVIISLKSNLDLVECSSCRVQLIDSNDYNILGEHADANVLDTCRLIYKDLVIPIFISQHVKVLVRVFNFEPTQVYGLLCKWTEMQFQHNLENIPKPNKIEEAVPITNKIPFISCSLAVDYKPKFHLGSLLVCGDRGSGKTHFIKNTLIDYGQFHGQYLNCKQLRGKRPEGIKKKFSEMLTEAFEKRPSIIALDDIDSVYSNDQKHEEEKGQEVLYKERIVSIFCYLLKQIERKRTKQVHLMASCQSLDTLNQRLARPTGRQYFNEVINLEAPDKRMRVSILETILAKHDQIRSSLTKFELIDISEKCSSYMPSDLERLCERAIINACSRSSLDFSSEPVTINMADFLSSVEDYTPMNLRSVALQPKSSRTFENVGGMKKIKEALFNSILLPIKYPKLHSKCPLKTQNSILLHGPSGCGKTLIAEALSNHEGINSICVRGPELLSKYTGASEAAVRDLFRRAKLARPCLIFLDEFESLVAKRGSDSTGVTDRVVNQFLTILDGVESLNRDIFIVAATSRPDLIDPAMLRPGRLGRHIYCPKPDEEDRLEILQVLSRNMDIDKDLDFVKWSKRLEGFSGADIQALLTSAQLKALRQIIDGQSREAKVLEARENLSIIVNERHFSECYLDVAAICCPQL